MLRSSSVPSVCNNNIPALTLVFEESWHESFILKPHTYVLSASPLCVCTLLFLFISYAFSYSLQSHKHPRCDL